MIQYKPSSVFNESATIDVGPQRFGHCFSFDFRGISLGCDSTDVPCDFTFTGFTYDPNTHVETQVASVGVQVPACSQPEKCALLPVTVSNFYGITAIRIKVTVNGIEDRGWWADDFVLAWTEDNCDIGACRANVPNTVNAETWSGTVRQVVGKMATLLGLRG